MTATIAPAVITEIFRKVDAIPQLERTPRALNRIATEHGLMLDELRTLLGRRRTPFVQRLSNVPPAGEVPDGHKTCTQCGEAKPVDDFYMQAAGKGGRMASCIACNNQRPPTVTRMVRNRARNRAYQVLVKAHAEEFARILERETIAAAAEHAALAAKAAAEGNPDAATARLKPGPKRKDETEPTQRLDVARCPSCHTHHDAAHQCPSCGDITPEAPVEVKAWEVRAWATDNGHHVPARGPLPAKVLDAYNTAHAQEAS